MVSDTPTNFTREEMIHRAFLRIARNIHDLWEETGHSDTRLFLEPLIPRSFVIVGQSKAGGYYNEHVVPRVVILRKCHEMFANGESIEAVAEFIRKFLQIVLISNAEQGKLDLNFKQKMPDGWSFESGDVFQRLRSADIDFDLRALLVVKVEEDKL